MIIPFFIPHAGCPQQCVFCNQKNIIGRKISEDVATLSAKINRYLSTNTSGKPVQFAFYGGTFTALPLEEQKVYLETVRPFLRTGQIGTIRLSTRPDCISPEGLRLLAEFHVTIVELGVQSLDDRVLSLSNRGHTAADAEKAVTMLRQHGLSVGIQLMPGLPGDGSHRFEQTVEKTVGLKPDFVRLYPALVIKDTPLEELYRKGRFTPLTLTEAVSLCRKAYVKFEQNAIAVIRMGLQPTEELEKPGTILAGPYHPAFRQLVESSLFLDAMRAALVITGGESRTAVFRIHPRDVSTAIGQRRENIETLKKEFGLQDVLFVEDGKISTRGKPVLVSGFKEEPKTVTEGRT